ncbi:conserved hypothetical protein [Planktothrix serta PCC 8927]|uniref:Zinc-ribbon domain-containing protein n=1 Tax=Planktothrix serta PCC 8927 TaxID=671068 RepID=A0A7Z9BU88_9CYAN|nr:zinc ribbon domain-containing protein [Planktothrix serta]VXD22829.1 conserved hypothetical protein [Planktothrix serta PCC 8927]
MAYLCELGAGQRVYLENQGVQTLVTLISSSPGQQQQASSSFTTGVWSSPPQVFQTPHGMVLKLTSEQGEKTLQIQGSSVTIISGTPSQKDSEELPVHEVTSLPVSPMPGIEPMEPMSPMKMSPMEPMKPMNLKMGDMQMSMNPMEMRMGNMELRMDSPAPNKQSFCSQCGTSVKPEDRFCSNCGHQL